jgi:uncharacterized protein YcfJ/Ni/Co efflux regulator RcnB
VLTMKSLGLVGLTLAMATVPVVANAANDSRGMQMGHAAGHGAGVQHAPRPATHNWGGRQNGRWVAGWRAPGGWNAYRPAVRGYVLPRYWVQPSFYIGNYSRYGFSTPQAGYGWSRYYDDAVLTDRNGRVYDSVRGVEWDQYDRYDDGGSEDYSDSYGYRDDGYSRDNREERAPRAPDRDGGIGGAVVGGVVGAVAGNVIGGRGNRLAGSLIGGGVGAIAGAVIDKNDNAGRGYSTKKLSRRDRERMEREDRRYDDRYEERGAHWEGGERHHGGSRTIYRSGPSYGYRYAQPAETIVTIHSAPVVTTTTYVTEEVTYVAAAKRRYHAPKRKWKPRPKPRCGC